MGDPRYSTALLDWLACAAGGRDEPAARAARALGDPVVLAGTAGHVLDFDDTYLPGIAHLSAPTAPAALVVAAELGLTVADALAAFADGLRGDGRGGPRQPSGAVRQRLAPDRGLRRGGRRGGGRDAAGRAARDAVAIALLRASGMRAAFGSDGKSLQVGLAAASGVAAARLAKAGARVPLERGAPPGSSRRPGGASAEPRRAGRRSARDRRQLDQGVALLPPDPRRDRGRRPARRERARRAHRDRPSGLAPGRRARS